VPDIHTSTTGEAAVAAQPEAGVPPEGFSSDESLVQIGRGLTAPDDAEVQIRRIPLTDSRALPLAGDAEVDSGAVLAATVSPVASGMTNRSANAEMSAGGTVLRTSMPPWHRLRRAMLRLGWGVADQGMSSVTNFAVTIYVAKTLGAAQFGAFSLAYVTYSFVLNASRGLATDPLVVRFSGAELPVWRRAVASSTGTALVVGLISGAAVLAAAMFLGGTARAAFIALGLTLPGLMLQDSWRYAFFALGRGSRALANDSVWAMVELPAFAALRMTHHANVFTFVLAWGASAAAAAAIGPLQARTIPAPSRVRAWLSAHRDLAPRYLAENTSNSGASQLRTYGTGFILGLAAVGYVQAASTLMGPFLVIFMGISMVTVPEAARVLRRSPRHLRLFCLLVAGGLALTAVAWGGALLVALPRGLGNLLLGSLWRPAFGLIPAYTISIIGVCVSAGATAGLHALGAARRSLRAMVFASVAYLACSLTGAALDGARGSVWGIALATWIGALLWWAQLRRGLSDAGNAHASGFLASRRSPGRHRDVVK
jgi:O-antigen/teichoic acid export membrane protein